MDRGMQNNSSEIVKKVKQSELRQFYKKVDIDQQQQTHLLQSVVNNNSNQKSQQYQQPSSVLCVNNYQQATPVNQLLFDTTINDSNININNNNHQDKQTAGRSTLSSQLVPSYIPQHQLQQYTSLDIHSNKKPNIQNNNTNKQKFQSLFIQSQTHQQNNNQHQYQPIYLKQELNQKLFQQQYYQNALNQQHQQRTMNNNPDMFQKQPTHHSTIEHKSVMNNQQSHLQHDVSDIDYNLSIQPQQIKLPDQYKMDPSIKSFYLNNITVNNNQQSKLSQNFLITPQNSILKSPSNITLNNQSISMNSYQISMNSYQISKNNYQVSMNNYQVSMNKFNNDSTPLINRYKNNGEKQPPSSQVIQRLRFHNYVDYEQQKTTNKQQRILANQQNIYKNQKQLIRSFSPQQQMIKPTYQQYQNIKKSHNNTKKSQQQSISIQSTNFKQQAINNNDNQIIQSDQDEDSSQLLMKIRQLQSQVTQLKSHKYQFAINQYRQQMKSQLNKKLQSSIKDINQRYDQQQLILKKQSQTEINLYKKSLQDMGKYKKTYAIILGQLKQNKDKIQIQYKEKIQEVNKFKQRMIHQWKRNSNQEIKKILTNTHTKHSIKLSASKQKLIKNEDLSIDNKIISPFIKQKTIINTLTQSK